MACRQCQGIERFFDDATARRELRRYRRRGPSASSRILLGALRDLGVPDRSFLDVGGGVGVVQHELMADGAAGGAHADASPAYLEASRSEAVRRGHADRIRYVLGDAVDLTDALEPADFVTLDRVVCCYHDMPGLIDATVPLARRAVGLVFPREHLPNRLGTRVVNLVQRLRGHPFAVFLHPTAAVVERVRRHGLEASFHATTLLWQVRVFVRPDATSAPAT